MVSSIPPTVQHAHTSAHLRHVPESGAVGRRRILDGRHLRPRPGRRAPVDFTPLVDISGDLALNSGDPAQTLADLTRQRRRRAGEQPLLVMHAHGRYRGVSGLFLTSTAEPRHQHEAEELSQAAAKVDIWSQVEVFPAATSGSSPVPRSRPPTLGWSTSSLLLSPRSFSYLKFL